MSLYDPYLIVQFTPFDGNGNAPTAAAIASAAAKRAHPTRSVAKAAGR
jgi:hypothetical protein